MAPNDNCKPTLAMAYGLRRRITQSAALSDVTGSVSRPKSGAAKRNRIMIKARITEGCAPTAIVNKKISGSASRAFSQWRFFPLIVSIARSKNMQCNPDTAVICSIPQPTKALYNSSDKSERSPVIIAIKNAAASPEYN